jgi:Domain of unknown function (DUF4262)
LGLASIVRRDKAANCFADLRIGILYLMAQQSFATERTAVFRRTALDERDQKTISDIETFGCTIIHITPTATGPSWSYTIGIFDTCGRPEIIAIGLKQQTAHFLLNEAARRLRKGIDLSSGRHRGMVGEVDCEFRPVDPKWMEHLMGWANWYYGDAPYPTLQAVYPDMENRFPEDAGFDESFQQPLLLPNRLYTNVEHDFWAAADPASSLFNWKFPDPPHTQVFLSASVHSGSELVTYVSRDIEDGAWQFLGDSMSGGQPPVVSCFHHPIDKDRSLEDLADLSLGWWAKRTAPGQPWIRCKDDSEPE